MAADIKKNDDFSKGPISKTILRLAVPMVLAQFVNVLYNIVDRMYIGHISDTSVDALTGVGVTFPILLMVTAFANLFGSGGTPLFSMARGAAQQGGEEGEKQRERAADVMNNTFSMLVITGVILCIAVLLLKKPVLYLFGASDATYPYADSYLSVYMLGSVFMMVSLGMNGFINAQGFANRGMLTVVIGAVVNIALDPLFIFVFDMGVQGAALATVLSQLVSAVWVVRFLLGKRTLFRLELKRMRPQAKLIGKITSLGISGFIMGFTSSAVQVACNAMLSQHGGDLFVAVMTVINSIREVTYTPVNGVTSAAAPVVSFNYGAQKYKRVRGVIVFTTVVSFSYMVLVWLVLRLFPHVFIQLFNGDPQLLETCTHAMHIYFFGCFMMALQMSAQYVAGDGSRKAGDFLFTAPQGHHRHSVDVFAAADPRCRCGRCVLGGGYLELCGRRRVLHYDAVHRLARIKTQRNGQACTGEKVKRTELHMGDKPVRLRFLYAVYSAVSGEGAVLSVPLASLSEAVGSAAG